MTMITRVGFCPYCKAEHRPRTDDAFVAIGATGQYHIYFADHTGEFGYVPHIYQLVKVIGENVIYRKICAMNECGMQIDLRYSPSPFRFNEKAWDKGIMPIQSWNALQKLRDTGYKI